MFRKKTVSLAVLSIIFLLTASIAVYIRLFPLRQHVSNNAWNKASLLIMNKAMDNVRSNMEPMIKKRLSPTQQQRFISQRVNEILAQDKIKFRSAIHQLAKKIDSADSNPHVPYLLASDSYYYFDLTQNIDETGSMTEKFNGSKYFNSKMAAPDGYWEPLNLHPYVGFGIHRFLLFFNKEIPLMMSVAFTPLVITLLALFFFIATTATMKISPWAIAISSVYFVLANIFLKRSSFGWYDNDPYNVLFPMLLMMILSFSFLVKTKRSNIMTGLALGTALALYSLFWQGWVFLASVIIASALLISIIQRVRSQPLNPRFHILFFSFVLSAIAGISLLFGWREIFVLFQEGWRALQGFFNTTVSIWPDTYIAVGELKKSSLADIIHLTGGTLFLIIAGIGFVAGGIRSFFSGFNTIQSNMWIIISALGTASVAVSLGAQRFTILCVTPLALLFSIGINDLVVFVKNQLKKVTPAHWQKIFPLFMAGFMLILIIPKIITAEQTMPELLNPIYNDTWHEALTDINQRTPSNSIINSWWPPGHFIKAIAKRQVTFDGASINNRQAYWLANALMAPTEREALDYFRLLNNSGNQAVDLLLEAGLTDSSAVSLLKSVIHLPESSARPIIEPVLNSKTDQLLALTHGTPAPSFLLLYNEMVENIILYPFVADWDLKKAELLNQRPDLLKKTGSRNLEERISFLWSMSGGQPKASEIFSLVDQQNDWMVFPNNININIKDGLCRIDSEKYGKGVPSFLFYEDNGKLIKKSLPGSNLPFSVVIGKRHGKHQMMLMENPLAESLLIRLYFFGDIGLKHFKLLDQYSNLTKQTQIDVLQIIY